MCRKTFHNGAMTYACCKFMKVLSTTFQTFSTFVAYVVLMEAMFPYFNLKPDDCNLATTILVLKLSQLHKTLILRMLWNSRMGLIFSKIHPGFISDFNITEKYSM